MKSEKNNYNIFDFFHILRKYTRKFLFFSTIPRFYIVGITGLIINLFVSTSLESNEIIQIHYLLATSIGIAISISSNFILNKIWTFKDKYFDIKSVIFQYSKYVCFSIIGIGLQLIITYILVETGNSYFTSLIIAIIIGSFSNYLLNKKFTFKDTRIQI